MKIEWSEISSGTIARTIVLIIALVNQVITVLGLHPLPISDEEIYSLVTIVFTIGASVWSWWKNNSVTKEAIAGDKHKESLK